MSTPSRPQVSLCLIVKDEEDSLARCLASADGLADEVVVYDTGSSDGTVALAESLGATVVRGEWHDDFGRARNEALAHCTGEWILHLDADEELTADVDSLRRILTDRRTDALSIEIVNLGAQVGDYAHQAVRLFRRAAGSWRGRLHERVVDADGSPLSGTACRAARITHHGYTSEAIEAGDKAARNLRIAHAELTQAGPDADVGALLVNVGRAYIGAQDIDFAIDHFRRAADLDRTTARPIALQLGAMVLTDLFRLDEARAWTDELVSEIGDDHDVVTYLRGSIDLFAGREAPALLTLAARPTVVGVDGSAVAEAELRRRVAAAFLAADRPGDAADQLLSVVDADPAEPVWGALVRACHDSGRGFDELVVRLPGADLRSVLAQVLNQPVPVAEAFGAVVRDVLPHDPRLVAFAVHHARRVTDLEPLIGWATTIRAAGLEESCPVIERAADPTVPAAERFTAAVVAHAAFRDPRALTLLDSITPLLTPADEPGAIHVLEELAPELLVTN